MFQLIPIMLYGWILVALYFFATMDFYKAIMFTLIGGYLFLPARISYDFPLVNYNKTIAITISLVIGIAWKGAKFKARRKFDVYDSIMLVYVFFSPIITSVLNGLGLYDGLSESATKYLIWGYYFWVGRNYFYKYEHLKLICYSFIVGGLIYVPLCLYEVIMSPQLSIKVYGFFAHTWYQHVRYNGYRPIVFMKHGLMVALWMAESFIIAFWVWREKLQYYEKIKMLVPLPLFLCVVGLFGTTILTKCSGSISFAIMAVVLYFFHKRKMGKFLFSLFILIVPFYMFFRASNIISNDDIERLMSTFFNPDRVYSLLFRLRQEVLFCEKAAERFLFGWGGYGRSRPINPQTGNILRIVDAWWIIIYGGNGIVGLISLFGSMLIGPWLIIRKWFDHQKLMGIEPLLLSLVIVFFALDSLLNAMMVPLYILISGALISFYLNFSKTVGKNVISKS